MNYVNACALLTGLMLSVANSALAGGWINDQNGCRAWNDNPSPQESITWTGKCVDGYADGKGVQVWFYDGKPTGEKYDGEMRRGQAHGKGVWISQAGDRYVGDWVEGKRTGKGTYTWPEGSRSNCSSQFCCRKYVGEWRDNKTTCGKMDFWSGDSYDGCYEADGSTFLGKTKFQLAEQSRTYERTSRCQHVYEGRVFRRKENNLVGLFGDLEYIVLGFSASRGQATVKDRHDGSVQEISCTSIPE